MTPTINEFEGLDGVEGEPPGSTGTDAGRQSSLHRPTPVPNDLLSSSSSLGRSVAHRPVTPTIREDDGHAQRWGACSWREPVVHGAPGV